MKSLKNRLHSVMVIGATPAGIVAVNKLGELGIPVTLVDADPDLNEKLSAEEYRFESGVKFNFAHRPGLIRIIRNPNIRCLLPVHIRSVRHSQQGFSIRIDRLPTYVDASRCTLCGKCKDICPVNDDIGQKPLHLDSRLSLPGRATIDKRREPLCQANCPLGVNAQGYIALARAGRYAEALRLIRTENVLPAICGRVCTHPCEDACRRKDVDSPLAIRDIKRFVTDMASKEVVEEMRPPLPSRSERIVVIGAGPAGIAAATDLARDGFRVTILERESAAGGLLRYGIGPHRLPREILDQELSAIAAEGVNIVTGRAVCIPEDLPDLKKEYDAVILAVGSWADRKLGVPGEDLEGIRGCVSFLAEVYRGRVSAVSGGVAVIGDGNAAFDMARTLHRLGAKVTILSWFDKVAIPADPHEISSALSEGIRIRDGHQVVGFAGDAGRLTHIRLQPTRPGPCDEQGIAWPEIIPGSEAIELPFNSAFVAIGQKGAYTPVQTAKGFHINTLGFIHADGEGRTGMKGVYATGDAVTGASSVVQAMAHGRKAAAAVMADFNSLKKPRRFQPARPDTIDFNPVKSDLVLQARVAMPELSFSCRQSGFSEVAIGYNAEQAHSEGTRCLQCGGCSQCLECLTACGANGAIRHDEPIESVIENVGVLIIADPAIAPEISGEDVIRAYGPPAAKTDVYAMVLRGYAAVAKAMTLLNEAAPAAKGHGIAFEVPATRFAKEIRIGVFACRCNDSFGWAPEMSEYLAQLPGTLDVFHAEMLPSACVSEGISHIIATVREKALTRLVLASCVCCPLNYVCSACTDQRSRLKQGLFGGTGISRSMALTFNLRGEVLRLMDRDPALAVESFKGVMTRSIRRAARLLPFPVPSRTYNFTTAVIGQTEAAAISALTLSQLGVDVMMFGSTKNPLAVSPDLPNIHAVIGSSVLSVSGTIGNFQLRVLVDGIEKSYFVGSVILGEKSRTLALYQPHLELPGQMVQSAMQRVDELGIPFMYPGTTSISGLFLADPPGVQISKRTKGAAAAVLTVAAMPRGPRQFRGFSVTVKESQCRSCGRCLQACPYQAVSLKQNALGGYTAVVDYILCKGCGNCISVCPSNAADSPFRDQAYLERTLEEMLVG